MWAEANCYYYRGKLVAKLKGGNVYTAPEINIPEDENGNQVTPEPKGLSLRPIDIDAMVAANLDILEILEHTTVKKILAVFTKYKDKLDCFHVAFSGGKDSLVLLDLVKKALPTGSFVVVFGDTGMEFPDTYEVISKTKQQCSDEDISFYIAESHLTPKESWKMFGPPSRVLRWCCSVHKSTPQTLKLREITGKDNYTGLAFVGVRAQESASRAEYEYENYGKKQRGQYSHNSILEWTSAEIWLYIYANNIFVNKAYKKGSARVGCLCCPMGGGKSGFIEYENYTNNVSEYFEMIESANGRQSVKIDEYIQSGGWSARKNGRDLTDNPNHYSEGIENKYLTIEIDSPVSDWQEWIKTIDIREDSYSVEATKTGYIARIKEDDIKKNPLLGKLFKQVFRKAACCKGCRVCEANCTNGALKFIGDDVNITKCLRCQKCHAIDSGCVIYHSIRHPQGGEKSMRSLNTMSNHAPKTEWLVAFFENKNNFFKENSLNKKNQLGPFKRFLRDAALIVESDQISPLAESIFQIGWDSETAQALILINLVFENPQIKWYVVNFDLGTIYSRKTVLEMLFAFDVKTEGAQSIYGAYKRLCETPLGTVLRFGFVTDEGELIRTKCSISDSRVVLYGLFKFAEKCNDYKEFTLATLLNDSIDRDGISPTRIFGLERDDMVPMLLGLTAKYPEFITASFTHDLEKITLAEHKTSEDVLDLFKGDTTYA